MKTPTNQQKPEATRLDSFSLEYIEMFPTIQGEGPLSGLPAIFLRLAGCNIKCPACDTQYTEGRKESQLHWMIEELAGMVKSHPCRPILVITGGEPFRQGPAVWKLVECLGEQFHRIQIETNGTLPWRVSDMSLVTARMIDNNSKISIVVSPKAAVNNWFSVLPSQSNWMPTANRIAWKYVLTHGQIDPIDGLPTRVLGRAQRPDRPLNVPPHNIYIQPADLKDEELNKLNLAACVESSQRFGYRLSLQVHKLAGLA